MKCSEKSHQKDVLKTMLEFLQFIVKPKKDVKCSGCNQTLANIYNLGKVGCPECYTTFGDKINPILSLKQGDENKSRNVELEEIAKRSKEYMNLQYTCLQQALAESIQEERFEEAAMIRDMLKGVDDLLQKRTLVEGQIRNLLEIQDFSKIEEAKMIVVKINMKLEEKFKNFYQAIA